MKRVAERNAFVSLLLARAYALAAAMGAIPYRLAQLPRSHVAWSARICGWRALKLGRNVVIGAGSYLNVNQRRVSRPSLRIGDNTFIGRDNFMSVGKSIVVREYCLTAPNCALIGSSHVTDRASLPYGSTGTTDIHEIYVGVNCFLGYGSVVLGNVKIGHGSIVGARAVVREDVPPFSMCAGSPCRVLKRFCFRRQSWIDIAEAQDVVFPDEEEYLLSLRGAGQYPIQAISAAATVLGDI
jgi:acetyltransferase-like isoleucine patch superfamily enzyme